MTNLLMRMNRGIGILAVFLLSSTCLGQDFKADFDKSFQAGDTLKQLEALKQWENSDPKNAELFTGWFNYYFNRSREAVVALTTSQPAGKQLSIEDSTGNTVGYLGSQVSYDHELMQRGIGWIDRGIVLFPDRLDMRFGKIYALGQMETWQAFTDEIITTIRYSSDPGNRWTWTNNEVKPEGKDFFLSSLQDYQLDLYNTGNDSLLSNMRAIAQEVLKYYPDNVESLSNLSVTYLLTGEYDKGIEPLLKAESINPKDGIVLGNIAQGYKLKGDTESAIKYYEKMLNLDDPEAKAFAQKQIQALQAH